MSKKVSLGTQLTQSAVDYYTVIFIILFTQVIRKKAQNIASFYTFGHPGLEISLPSIQCCTVKYTKAQLLVEDACMRQRTLNV